MESGGGGGYDDPRLTNVVLDSLWIPSSSSPASFHGSMVNFEDAEREAPTLVPLLTTQIDPKVEDEVYSEKKRRLSPEQVVFLEKSFEVENKLEPERKLRLAKELGLQPRQVAIWFQNRRARYKTKLLQKEYDLLKSTYENLKADYDSLYKQNQRTKNELKLLTDKLNGVEDPTSGDDPISPLDLLHPKNKASSVVDSDSGGIHEDSSNAFESDFSQDEDDSRRRKRRRRLDRVPPLQLGCFPPATECCDDDLQPNSCNLGFPVLDQGTWFWQY